MHKRIITVSEKVLNENRFNEVTKRKENEEEENWFSKSFREFCSATALVYIAIVLNWYIVLLIGEFLLWLSARVQLYCAKRHQ